MNVKCKFCENESKWVCDNCQAVTCDNHHVKDGWGFDFCSHECIERLKKRFQE